MALIKLLAIAICISFIQASAIAANSCQDLFATEISASKMSSISFEANIPSDVQKLIRDTISETQKALPNLKGPESIIVSRTTEERSLLAAADAETNHIAISGSFLHLSMPIAKAVISHEYIHMVVMRGFRVPGREKSLYEAVTESKDPSEDVMLLVEMHTPYAEILCDLMPTLMSRDPRLFTKMIGEAQAYMRQEPELMKFADRFNPEAPKELSIRDFSVSENDARWESYNPRDMTYNRFNQIRSYLWNRWIKNLPPGQEVRFFEAAFATIEKIHHSSYIDNIMMYAGTPNSNLQFIQFLETNLAKEFGPP